MRKFWQNVLEKQQSPNRVDTWDYSWQLCLFQFAGFCINPKVNLVSNIGECGTHFSAGASGLGTPVYDIYEGRGGGGGGYTLTHPPLEHNWDVLQEMEANRISPTYDEMEWEFFVELFEKKINSKYISDAMRFYEWFKFSPAYQKEEYKNFAAKIDSMVEKLETQRFAAPVSLPPPSKTLIYLATKQIHFAGLVDRLRGITVLYKISKELNVDFKIHFTYPFKLKNFIEPNLYDWDLSDNVDFYVNQKSTFCLLTDDKKYPTRGEMKNEIQHCFNNNSIVYSHARLGINFKNEFSALFNELFKPSPALHAQINEHLEKIGNDYISAHFRFIGLFGDFNEQIYGVLERNEQNELLNTCIKRLFEIHNENPNKKIFVATDSITFLNSIKNFDFIYTIEGDISHVIGENLENIDYTKLFLDFFLISNSKKVYKVVEGKMYDGAFAYIASLLHNIPYILKFAKTTPIFNSLESNA